MSIRHFTQRRVFFVRRQSQQPKCWYVALPLNKLAQTISGSSLLWVGKGELKLQVQSPAIQSHLIACLIAPLKAWLPRGSEAEARSAHRPHLAGDGLKTLYAQITRCCSLK